MMKVIHNIHLSKNALMLMCIMTTLCLKGEESFEPDCIGRYFEELDIIEDERSDEDSLARAKERFNCEIDIKNLEFLGIKICQSECDIGTKHVLYGSNSCGDKVFEFFPSTVLGKKRNSEDKCFFDVIRTEDENSGKVYRIYAYIKCEKTSQLDNIIENLKKVYYKQYPFDNFHEGSYHEELKGFGYISFGLKGKGVIADESHDCKIYIQKAIPWGFAWDDLYYRVELVDETIRKIRRKAKTANFQFSGTNIFVPHEYARFQLLDYCETEACGINKDARLFDSTYSLRIKEDSDIKDFLSTRVNIGQCNMRDEHLSAVYCRNREREKMLAQYGFNLDCLHNRTYDEKRRIVIKIYRLLRAISLALFECDRIYHMALCRAHCVISIEQVQDVEILEGLPLESYYATIWKSMYVLNDADFWRKVAEWPADVVTDLIDNEAENLFRASDKLSSISIEEINEHQRSLKRAIFKSNLRKCANNEEKLEFAYKQYSSCFLNIKGKDGSAGSGFIVKTDGGYFLYTNRHVVEGAGTIHATTANGHSYKFQTMEVASGLDLVRCKLKEWGNNDAIEIAENMPLYGDLIAVVGNSDGLGIQTMLTGKVIGSNKDLIEVDAGFVKGNSGSPVININGDVVGVATLAVKVSDDNDWVRKGTRFADTRRFAITLVNKNIKWKTVNPKEFMSGKMQKCFK